MTSTTMRPTSWRLFVAGLLLALLAAAPARAVCITDQLGPDNVPGQKDLNEWCEPGPTCSSSSATLSLRWQFDDVNWRGSNTGDSCALIDTNRDGLADRAICVTVFGAAQMAGKCSNNQFLGCIKNQDCGSGGTCIFPINNTGAPRCYTCGNDRPTRCTKPRPVACTSLCSVGVAVGSDPFSGVASHTARKCNGTNCVTNDTAVNCCLTSTDIGTSGELIDVCSYPSQRPNSDPSDCVITPPNCNSDADCDDHNPCTVDRCATGTGGVKFCDSVPGNAGTVCRPSAGPCDVPEYCTGSSADCPPDESGAGCTCATGADCNDHNVCTYDSCDAGVCSNTWLEGCRPCATAADCNDNNACTTESCVAGVCYDTPISGCCTTVVDCDDHNACTTDTCGAGACHHAAISGCTPCTTVANCNDFNACTTDTCIGGACVHTNTCLAPAAVPTETCGNCIDDDGNGLTDFEDPACSGQAGTLTLEEGRLRPSGDATRLDLHSVLAGSGLGVNPLADDVILQIRPENGTDVLCARIPAASFVKHRRLFKFADPKHAVASAQGLDDVRIQVQANGSVRLRAGGKRAQMICPDAGALQMTVGFHNATAGDGGNRSATTVQTFSAGPNGTLRIP